MNRVSIVAILTTSLVLLFPCIMQAQHRLPVRPDCEDTRLGFGIGVGLPTRYDFKSALNAQLRWQHDFSPYVSGLLSLGYISFLRDDHSVRGDYQKGLNLIPMKAGLKIFPLARVYISGEFGLAFTPGYKQAATFAYAPSLGFEFYEGLDLGLSYEMFNRYKMANVAFKVSYGFDLTRHSGYDAF